MNLRVVAASVTAKAALQVSNTSTSFCTGFRDRTWYSCLYVSTTPTASSVTIPSTPSATKPMAEPPTFDSSLPVRRFPEDFPLSTRLAVSSLLPQPSNDRLFLSVAAVSHAMSHATSGASGFKAHTYAVVTKKTKPQKRTNCAKETSPTPSTGTDRRYLLQVEGSLRVKKPMKAMK
jgi:hypothetical protein